ncbi:hypothetical protein E2L00_18025 [Cedecea colo]|uniref:Uncharacterized protein n=1 Tax=Cedecea colo TaxID=2552946 RepID=A0ABX0VT37_9ENTR|nr:hypothetical protein [Cedecea colo]
MATDERGNYARKIFPKKHPVGKISRNESSRIILIYGCRLNGRQGKRLG